jgi:two-component system phosphate regulon sensor histidine kinase PhoR
METMSRNSDNAEVMSRTEDPVDQVMSMIKPTEGLPDLMDLAKAFLATWSWLPGVRAAAVAANPAVTILLDPTHREYCDSWLVMTRDPAARSGEPLWVDMAGSWSDLAAVWAANRSNDSEVLQGAGPLPGGEPWSEADHGFEPVSCAGWLVAPIDMRGQVKFALVLGLEGDPDRFPAIRETMVRLVKALFPVVAVWSVALSLNARLRQADDENRALARLNRLQGRFVAMASHEFKTPLTSITAYTDVLGEQLADADFPQTREFLGVIRNEAGRLLRMVNRILDFTRMEHGSPLLALKPVDMEPLVRDTVRSLGPKIARKDLVVTVEAPAGLPRAEVDPDLIRQVLVNLLHNAVKFTPRAGRITIRLQEKESAVAVSVMDNGPGIPPEDIRRIFQEFYRAEGGTSNEEGSGLGLTIARHIVNLHGGHIEVERRPEGGSDFRFLVPKEMGSMASLADVLRRPVDPEEGARLVENLLFLLAEMTGSRTVVMLLRDGNGALVPVGAIGLDLDVTKPLPLIENEGWTRFLECGEAVTDPGSLVGDLGWCPEKCESEDSRMYSPLGTGESVLGCVILGRRRGLKSYDQADLIQLSVLSEIVWTALSDLETGLDRTTATVRLLLRIRRNGVPTATAQSLALTQKLGVRLGLNRAKVKRLQLAAVLHDAGMAQVEEEIVLGESELSLDERDEVGRHVEQVVDLLGPLLPDRAIEKIIRHHHERFDGTGYPEGLRGEDIPFGSRLMAVIDTWFSLTSSRPFRGGLSPAAAHGEILAHAGTQFDGRIVAEFTKVLFNEGVLTDAPAAAGPVRSGS